MCNMIEDQNQITKNNLRNKIIIGHKVAYLYYRYRCLSLEKGKRLR